MNSNAFSGMAYLVQAAISILISTGVWTLIAFFFYGIFKVFKIARYMEENQKHI